MGGPSSFRWKKLINAFPLFQRTSGLAELTGALSNQEAISSTEGVGNFRNPRVGYLEYTFSVQANKPLVSEPITVHGINWNIVVRINETTLGVFLNGTMSKACTCSHPWKCRVSATVRLHNFKDIQNTITMSYVNHFFQASPNSWGFREFVKMEEILDKDRGFIRDGMARFEVYMYAEEPKFD